MVAKCLQNSRFLWWILWKVACSFEHINSHRVWVLFETNGTTALTITAIRVRAVAAREPRNLVQLCRCVNVHFAEPPLEMVPAFWLPENPRHNYCKDELNRWRPWILLAYYVHGPHWNYEIEFCSQFTSWAIVQHYHCTLCRCFNFAHLQSANDIGWN